MILDAWLVQQLEGWLSHERTGIDEENTKNWILFPMLDKLGWRYDNPAHAHANWPVGNEKIDMALLDGDGEPVVLFEIKKASQTLTAGIEAGVIDLAKYEGQLGLSRAPVLVLTNGLDYQFLVKLSDGVRQWCDAVTINLRASEPDRRAASLYLLQRDAVLSRRSIDYLFEAAARQHAHESVRGALCTPSASLLDALAAQTGLAQDRVIAALSAVFDEHGTGCQRMLPFSASTHAMTEREKRLQRKMVGQTAEARKWRANAKQFLPIWEAVLTAGCMTREDVLNLLQGLGLPSKALGQWFSSYTTQGRSPVLVRPLENAPATHDGVVYEVNPCLREALEQAVWIMRGGARDRRS